MCICLKDQAGDKDKAASAKVGCGFFASIKSLVMFINLSSIHNGRCFRKGWQLFVQAFHATFHLLEERLRKGRLRFLVGV